MCTSASPRRVPLPHTLASAPLSTTDASCARSLVTPEPMPQTAPSTRPVRTVPRHLPELADDHLNFWRLTIRLREMRPNLLKIRILSVSIKQGGNLLG